MKLVLTEFVTLDGVSQGPGSPTEDTSDGFTRGGWLVPHLDETFIRRTSEWLDLADGLLLGRRTYEAFARDWPQITDPDDPFTLRMNALPKYVVTNTLAHAGWHPTTILTGDALKSVAGLKAQPGRELQIHGSARLGQTLLAAGLVDTLRLTIAPTIAGCGRRLLDHPTSPTGLNLTTHETTPSGLLLLEYTVTGAAPHSHLPRHRRRRPLAPTNPPAELTRSVPGNEAQLLTPVRGSPGPRPAGNSMGLGAPTTHWRRDAKRHERCPRRRPMPARAQPPACSCTTTAADQPSPPPPAGEVTRTARALSARATMSARGQPPVCS